MTAPTETGTETEGPSISAGRPVLRLVILAASVVLLLLSIWWTGAVAPRARVHHTSSSGEADPATGWAYAAFEITNDGRFPVEIGSVMVARDRDDGELAIYLRDPDVSAEQRSYPVNPAGMLGRVDLVEQAPFELAGGASREVVLLFEGRCPDAWPTEVQIEATSATGVTRTVELHGQPAGTWSTPDNC